MMMVMSSIVRLKKWGVVSEKESMVFWEANVMRWIVLVLVRAMGSEVRI
jgi:hypothetical protein